MAGEYKGLTIRFRGESGDLTKALSRIGSEARTAQSRLRGVQSALRLDPKSPKLLAEQLRYASETATRARERLNTLRDAQDRLAASGDTTSETYRRLSYDIARTEAYYRRDAEALARVAEGMTGLGRASTALDAYAARAEAASGRISELGSRLTAGVTLPLVAVGGIAVKSAIDIDTALTGVRKTVDMTEEGYRRLKEGAVELSKTQPVSAETILGIEELGGQLGWSNDKLQDFAMTVSGLDIATDMDASTAATNLAQFANVTGMAQEKASNYASAIVGLGNNMATTESKISEMAQNMASAGTQAGMSEADILGVAAAVSSLGMEAQAGGSAFSRTLTDIGMEVSTNGEHLAQWAALAGMSVEEFKSAWGSDVTGTLQRVVQGMGQVSASGGDLNVTLSDLGITELRQSDLLRRLAGNSDLLTRAVGLSNQSWSENTALSKEVGNRNESVASKLEVARNRAVAMAQDVGGPLADALIDALGAAEPLIQGAGDLAKAFADMDEGQQRAIIGWAAAAAAAGPALSVMGKFVGATGKVAGGLSGGVKAVNSFRTAMNATNPALIEGYRTGGSLAAKIGLIGNRSVAAAGGARRFGDAVTNMERRTGRMVAELTPAQAKMASFANGTDEARLGLSGLAGGAVRAATSVVGAIGAIGAAFAAAQVVNEVWKLSIGYDRNADAARAAAASASEFAEAMSSTQGAAVNLDVTMDSSGNTISGLQQTTSEAFSNIVATIQSSMEESGVITQQAADEIARNFERIRQASNDEATAYANAIAAAAGAYDKLDSSNVAQYVADVKAAFESGKTQLKGDLDKQLQMIESYHQQVGDVGSEAYNRDVQAAKDAYKQQIDTITRAKDDALSKTDDLYGQIGDKTLKGFDEIARIAEENRFSGALDGGLLSSINLLASGVESEFNKVIGEMDLGATGAWLAAQAATVSGGAALDKASRDNIERIIGPFDGLPERLQEQGVDTMRSLADSIEAGGVELGDTANMSCQQIVDAIHQKLGVEGALAAGEAGTMTRAQLKAQLDAIPEDAAGAGSLAGASLATALGATGDTEAAAAAQKAAAERELAAIPGAAAAAGAGGASGLGLALGQTGAVSGSAAALAGAAQAPLRQVPGAAAQAGTGAGTGFGSGLGSGAGQARTSAQTVADAAKAPLKGAKEGMSESGLHLGQNFASGLGSALSAVGSAASRLAAEAKRVLGFSVPEAGPWSGAERGGETSGLHLGQNFAAGMLRSVPEIRSAARAVSAAMAPEPPSYRSGWAAQQQSRYLAQSIDANVGEAVTGWLEANLGPIIAEYAPTATPREWQRMMARGR